VVFLFKSGNWFQLREISDGPIPTSGSPRPSATSLKRACSKVGTGPAMKTIMDKPKDILCPLCGGVNPGGAESCRSCGNLLTVSRMDDFSDDFTEFSGDETALKVDPRARSARFRLVMIDEEGTELESFEIKNGSMIGRTQGDIQLRDRYVSRSHCAFKIQKGRLYLKDLDSTNGVFLRIRNSATFAAPAELMIGHTICRVIRKR
jgi:FHA domain